MDKIPIAISTGSRESFCPYPGTVIESFRWFLRPSRSRNAFFAGDANREKCGIRKLLINYSNTVGPRSEAIPAKQRYLFSNNNENEARSFPRSALFDSTEEDFKHCECPRRPIPICTSFLEIFQGNRLKRVRRGLPVSTITLSSISVDRFQTIL